MFDYNTYFNQLKNLLNQVGIELSDDNSSPTSLSHLFATLEFLGFNLNETILTCSYRLIVYMYDINFNYEPHIKLLEYVTVAIMYIFGTKQIQTEIMNSYLDEKILNTIIFTFQVSEPLSNRKLLEPDNYLLELQTQINL